MLFSNNKKVPQIVPMSILEGNVIEVVHMCKYLSCLMTPSPSSPKLKPKLGYSFWNKICFSFEVKKRHVVDWTATWRRNRCLRLLTVLLAEPHCPGGGASWWWRAAGHNRGQQSLSPPCCGSCTSWQSQSSFPPNSFSTMAEITPTTSLVVEIPDVREPDVQCWVSLLLKVIR